MKQKMEKYSGKGGLIMKKLLSLAIAFTAALSLSACTVGNNRINDRNKVGYDGGIGTRRLSQENIINNTNLNYRDGIYTGYGDDHTNGNERAIVEIRNGRIANIDLARVNNTTRTGINTQTTPGTVIDNQMGTGIGTRTGTGTGTVNQPILRNTPGSTTNYMPGTTTGDWTQNIDGSAIGNTGIPANIPRNTTGNVGTNINTAGGGITQTGIDGVRTNLTNMMIQNQSYDVNVTNNDSTLIGTINNWKLAVRRALDQARR